MKPHEIVEVTVDALAHGGRGIARHEGFVLFVQRGLPGERVRARVTRIKKSFAEAVVEEVLVRSPHGVEPPCRFHGTCGGCAWQGFDYVEQLAAKQAQVAEAIQRIGGYEDFTVRPIVAAGEQLGYRNKMEYSFAADEEGTVSAGFHALGRWDQIVPVDPCLIADPRGLPVVSAVVAWANANGLTVYDRDEATGLLRHLVVRVGRATGEIMVNLVTGPGKVPKIAELADDLGAEVPGVVSVLHSVVDSRAEVSHGGTIELLWGREWFEEELAGVRLRVRPESFMQTNTAMAEKLYRLAIETAQLGPDDVVWDLYCGIGSISLALARHCRHVHGIEIVEEAIVCARENAAANGIENVSFQAGNVRPALKFIGDDVPAPDVIVVDPPRSGLVDKVIRRVCERSPRAIVYVSCNPATFAGNLPKFREHGYELTFAQPVDQFPHTPHVELVARLEPASAQPKS